MGDQRNSKTALGSGCGRKDRCDAVHVGVEASSAGENSAELVVGLGCGVGSLADIPESGSAGPHHRDHAMP